jgi:hypothetical protein
MSYSDKRAISGGHPKHHIADRQIGEQLPVVHEKLQPLDVFGARITVCFDKFLQGAHPFSLAGEARDSSLSIPPQRASVVACRREKPYRFAEREERCPISVALIAHDPDNANAELITTLEQCSGHEVWLQQRDEQIAASGLTLSEHPIRAL